MLNRLAGLAGFFVIPLALASLCPDGTEHEELGGLWRIAYLDPPTTPEKLSAFFKENIGLKDSQIAEIEAGQAVDRCGSSKRRANIIPNMAPPTWAA
jgi:hypothetical protein